MNKSEEKTGYETAKNLSELYNENWQYKGFEVLLNGNERHHFALVTKKDYYSLSETKIEKEGE